MKAYLGSMCSALGACASLVLAAGCAGSQTPANSLVPSGLRGATPAPARGSWIDPDAQTRDLLYVSDRMGGNVSIYSYPAAKLQGRLVNIRANGLCSNKNGDVFIPEGNTIKQYRHGGIRPIAVLHSPLGGAVQFCAVDPATEASPFREASRASQSSTVLKPAPNFTGRGTAIATSPSPTTAKAISSLKTRAAIWSNLLRTIRDCATSLGTECIRSTSARFNGTASTLP